MLFVISVESYAFRRIDNTIINFKTFASGCAESAVTYLTEIPLKLSRDIGPYRYYFDEGIGYTYYNLSMTNSLPSINSFISTCNNSITEFYRYLGYTRTTTTFAVSDDVKNLLGVKYILNSSVSKDAKFLINSNGQFFSLNENFDAIPIGGLQYDSYITESEFMSMNSDIAPAIMLRYMVVKDEDESIVESTLHHVKLADLIDDSSIHYTDVTDFQTGKNQFSTEVTTDNSGYIFFSVPYDQFWKCTVNGEQVNILNVNGLMAVPAPKGNLSITFSYCYKPLSWIILCSALGTISCLSLLASNKVKKKHNIL